MEIDKCNHVQSNETLRSLIDNPSHYVNESFSNYVIHNNLQEITNETISEWDLVKDISEKYSLDFDDKETIRQIPNISACTGKPLLVKLQCMTQNVLENQLYIAAGKDEKTDTFRLNKYLEHFPDKNQMETDEDDLGFDMGYSSSLLSERLVLRVIAIPGANYDIEGLTKDDKDFLHNKTIIIYDYTNQFSKVNESLMVIGVAFYKDNEIIIHSWRITRNYLNKQIENKVLDTINFSGIREMLLNTLSKVYNRNFAEYILLFLLSQNFARVDNYVIGNFPLNAINFSSDEKAFQFLVNLLHMIVPFCIDIPITTEELNKCMLFPRFDSHTDELQYGALQTVDKTFVILNEQDMKEGKLNDIGCKNVTALQNLINFQTVDYEYPYSAITIQHDSQVLILTNKSRSLFNSVYLSEVICDTCASQEVLEEVAKAFNDNLRTIREYFFVLRYDEKFSKDFQISQSLSEKMQKDFLESYSTFISDDFSRCLKLARLNAVSHGRNEMVYEDYEFIKNCEDVRKITLNKLLKKIEK